MSHFRLARRAFVLVAMGLIVGIGADDQGVARPRVPIACCYDPGETPDWDHVHECELALESGFESQIFARWTATATNPSTGVAGDPITLRYSFIPDGTPMYGGAGEPATPSNLFATFNPLFGSAAAWQAPIAAAFAKWSQVSGVTFIHEPNDDGNPTANLLPGVIGVRGDIRIGGHAIDGPSGSNILGYSSYPNFGDITLDTTNLAYFANPFDNYRALRNLMAHEIGHAAGLKHVCPWNVTKLMEPFVSNAFDGPQHDDLLGIQRQYGDRFENNDTQATATDLGVLAAGTLVLDRLSCDGNGDADWFRFTTTGLQTLSVTVTPVGMTYLEGPEVSGVCTGGAAFNSLVANDLALEVRTGSGGLLGSANLHPAGAAESITGLALPSPGTSWYVEVIPGPANAVQLYQLQIALADTAGVVLVGSGCGAGSVPVLGVTVPVIGASMTVTVSNAAPNAAGSLMMSYGTPLPTSLGTGCTAYVNLTGLTELVEFVTSPSGTWTATGVVPQIPSLSGVDVVLQAAIYPTAAPIGFDVTNGVSAQVGY
jgi:hypothetical protein